MSELLALTNAAMLSMKASQDLSQPKVEDVTSASVDGIFSPLSEAPPIINTEVVLSSNSNLNPHNIHHTNGPGRSSPVDGGTSIVLASEEEASNLPIRVESDPGTSKAPLLLNDSSTPSPLTVSAQDIDGGSWDFTELAGGVDVSSRQRNDEQVLGLLPSRLKLEESVSTSRQNKENLVFTPPQNTSSPSGPIRVRMSAKKLREIQSPYSSDLSTLNNSTSSTSMTRKEGSNSPKVVTVLTAGQHHHPSGIEENSRPHKQPYHRQLQSKTNMALKQGVLYSAAREEDIAADASDESIVIARSSSDGKHRKLKLLQWKTDDGCKELNHTTLHPVVHIVDHPTASVNQNQSNNGSSGKLQNLHHPVPVHHDLPNTNQQRDDASLMGQRGLEETVKLVASCTAAATAAAVLATNSGDGVSMNKKPVSSNGLGSNSWLTSRVKKVPSSPTHAVNHLCPSTKINTHSKEQETLKNNNACGIINELEVSNDNNNHPKQRKQVSQVTQLKNDKALHNELQRNLVRTMELCSTADHCEGQDISYSQQAAHLEPKPFKKRAKMMAAKFPTTVKESTKKSKRRARDLSSEDSSNVHSLSKQFHPLQPVDHRGLEFQSYYASRSSEIQMKDVLQRLQKLEEFQHAHAMGTIKGVYQPHTSNHSTTQKSLSEERKPNSHWSKNAEQTNPEREFNFTSVSSLPFTMTTMRSHAPMGAHDTNSPLTTDTSPPDCDNHRKGTDFTNPTTSAHMETMPHLHVKPDTPEIGMQKVRGSGRDAVSVQGAHTRKLNAASVLASGVSPNQTLDRYAHSEHSKEHFGELTKCGEIDEGMDALVQAAKVLSSVQQSRQEIELQFALEQSEGQMVDLAVLMKSLQNRESSSLDLDSSESSVDNAEIACKVMEFLSSGQDRDTLPGDKGGQKMKPQRQARPSQKPASKCVNPTTVSGKRQPSKSHHLQPLQTQDMMPRMRGIQPPSVVVTSHHHLPSEMVPTPHVQSAFSQKHVNTFPPTQNMQQFPPPSLGENSIRQPQSLATSAQLTSQNPVSFPDHPSILHHKPTEGSYPSLMQVEPNAFPISMAVPLGAPCIMPSPLPTEALPGVGVAKSSPHLSSLSIQPSTATTKSSQTITTADVCLQTSTHLSSSLPADSEEIAQENEGSTSSKTESVEVISSQGLPGFDAALRECVDQDTSRQEMDAQEVDSVCEEEKNGGISIKGHRQLTPPPASPLTHAQDHFSVGGGEGSEGQVLSSEELDQQLREHVEHRALEWVKQELLAQMLTQVKVPCDPVPVHCHDNNSNTTNTCSTCSPTPNQHDIALAPLLGSSGVQLFVDAGVPVEDGAVVELVRDAVKEQISEIVREMVGASQQDKPEDSTATSNVEVISVEDYTPPESGSVISSSSTSTSESTTSILSTPHPTPPHSPTPSLEHTLISEEPSESTHVTVELDTPTVTPPLQRREPNEDELSEQDTISTPQFTEDDVDSSSVSETTIPQLTSRSTPSMSHNTHEISTPSVTPISEPPHPPDSPPQTTSEEATPQQQEHTKEPILSESSTTSTTHLSSNKYSLTSSSSDSTDREISMGEYILKRRPVPFVLANTSLSEGEVPLSPGDARWYSLYAAKIGKLGVDNWRGQHQKRKKDTTVEAFLDLKNTPDPSSSSDSSQFSDILQSDSKVLSAGEVRKPKIKCGADPFEKFLSKLNAFTPDHSSTPTGPTENTLSEMSSLGADDPRLPNDSPPPTRATSHVKQSRNIPYHRKYPLKKTQFMSIPGHSSPGEVPRELSSLHGSKPRQKHVSVAQDESGIQATLSEGEVPASISSRKRHIKSSSAMRDDIQVVPIEVMTSSNSLTETHSIKDDTANELRDGIDVINVSKYSSKLMGNEPHTGMPQSHTSSPQSVNHVQPVGEASHVLVVRPLADEDLNRDHKSPPKVSPKHTTGGIMTHQRLKVIENLPVEREKGLVEDDLKISNLEISDSPPSSSLKEEHLLYPAPQMTGPPQSSPLRSPQRSPQPPPVITIPSAAPTENLSSDSPISEQLATDYTSDFDFSSISLPGN